MRDIAEAFRGMAAPLHGSEPLEDWLGSEPPDRPPAYVIADGMNTSGSVERPPGLMTRLAPEIASVHADARIQGCSFSRPGKAYDERYTNISLLGPRPQTIVDAYVSRSPADTTYIIPNAVLNCG